MARLSAATALAILLHLPGTAPTQEPLRVRPMGDTLVVGDTVRLALVQNSQPVPASRWRSTDLAVASVDSAGRLRAVSPGLAVVIGHRANAPDSAMSQLLVLRLQLVPADTQVAPGARVTFVPRLTGPGGGERPRAAYPRPLQWSAAPPSVATMALAADSGLVTAVNAGTATIVAATGRGGAASARLVVRDTAVPAARECDQPRPGWLWCDDFEVDRLSRYFEYAAAGGRFVRVPGVGRDSSTGMRARFVAGSPSAGALKVAVGRVPDSVYRTVDSGGVVHRELYWRFWVRHAPGWGPGGGSRLTAATSLVNRRGAQAMSANLWPGRDAAVRSHLFVDPASGTSPAGTVRTRFYNDFAGWRWLGRARSARASFDTASAGRWQCVEAHARLNGPGRADGVMELWIDTVFQARRDSLNWLGSFAGFGINGVLLENAWPNAPARQQDRYFDNFVVSTRRIGC